MTANEGEESFGDASCNADCRFTQQRIYITMHVLYRQLPTYVAEASCGATELSADHIVTTPRHPGCKYRGMFMYDCILYVVVAW